MGIVIVLFGLIGFLCVIGFIVLGLQEYAKRETKPKQAKAKPKSKPESKAKPKQGQSKKGSAESDGALMNELITAIETYVQQNYEKCDISVPKDQQVRISKDAIKYNETPLAFTFIFNNRSLFSDCYFDYKITYGDTIYSFQLNYTLNRYLFITYITKIIYPWYSKQRGRSTYDSGSYYSGSTSRENWYHDFQ